jgi:hypothetical protein
MSRARTPVPACAGRLRRPARAGTGRLPQFAHIGKAMQDPTGQDATGRFAVDAAGVAFIVGPAEAGSGSERE